MSISTPALTNFTAGELSPRLEGRVDLSKYFNGCRELLNFVVHPHGGVQRRSGFRFMRRALCPESILVPYETPDGRAFVLEFGEEGGAGRIRAFESGADPAAAVTFDSPYRASELKELRWAQSEASIVFVHPAHAPARLYLDEAWKLESLDQTFFPDTWKDANWPSQICFHENRMVLASTPDQPATIWFSQAGNYSDFRLRTAECPLEHWRDFEIRSGSERGDGSAGHTFKVLRGDAFEKESGIKGINAAGEIRYYVYKGVRSFIAENSDITITFGTTSEVQIIECVHNEDGSLNAELWDEFTVGDRVKGDPGKEPLDDDAMEATLSGLHGGGICFLASRGSLRLGTPVGEWSISGASSAPLTPAGIRAVREGSIGAASMRPCEIGSSTVFVQRSGGKVREMTYRLQSDGFISRDLTLLAGHVTQSGIVDMACVSDPDLHLYCARADGMVALLTCQQDENVVAWSRIESGGSFRRLCVARDASSGDEELWAVVQRRVGGADSWFIEKLDPPFAGDVREAFFVDSGVTYRGISASEISGLDHLVGEAVDIVCDGAVHPSRIVSETGTITLDRPAAVVHAGLGYVSSLRPMRPEGGSARGTSQTKKKRITRLSIRFYQTLGGYAGADENRLESLGARPPSTPMGQPVEAWSGDRTLRFPGGWERDGDMVVVQKQPLPMTILLMVPELVVNE